MGHRRKRPYTGTTPAGVGIHYIVVETFLTDTRIAVIANGTVTFTVDSTIQNILYTAVDQAAVNVASDADRYIAPTAAVWANEIASGSANAEVSITDKPIFAVRINITAGTGSVTYTINQG
jgi:hypothetical protein